MFLFLALIIAKPQGVDIPLVVIETPGGSPIPDEPKILAHMKVIDNGSGSLNHPSDAGNVYDGIVGIEIRGAYSVSLPQKPYGFETRDSTGENLNVSLLGMPPENDWILLANYNDKSFVRNALAGHIFRMMGHYAPRTRHVEVIVNDSYEGIYVLTEKIKRDKNRVDISKLNPWEINGDDVTGGYIFATDYYSTDDSWTSSFPPYDKPGATVRFVYYYPKPDEITDQQKHYLQSFVNTFEETILGPGFKDLQTGYAAYLDVNSFRDYFILSEVTRNVDAYKKSRFFYKDKESLDGKIHSGPPWDYDWAMKDIYDCHMFANTDGSGWAYRVNECDVWPTPPVYMTRLLEDERFAGSIKQRYDSLRASFLSTLSLFVYIDSVTDYLSEAQCRHYTRWDILGKNVGAPEVGPVPSSFDEEINKFKDWITTRLGWLDRNMSGDLEGSVIIPVNGLRIFPNPASGHVFVESDGLIDRIEVCALDGRRVILKPDVPGRSAEVDITGLARGLYLVQITLNGGESVSGKLFVE